MSGFPKTDSWGRTGLTHLSTCPTEPGSLQPRLPPPPQCLSYLNPDLSHWHSPGRGWMGELGDSPGGLPEGGRTG